MDHLNQRISQNTFQNIFFAFLFLVRILIFCLFLSCFLFYYFILEPYFLILYSFLQLTACEEVEMVVRDCECKSPKSSATEFLNSCQNRTMYQHARGFFTVDQDLKAQRESRGITLLFL